MSTTNNRTLSTTSVHGLRHDLPPMRLWQKAKKLGIWNPSDIDLTQDKLDWQGLQAIEQDYLLRLCSQFLAGEESVTLDLLPLIMTVAEEGRLEEEIYLTSFLWEEAKHVEGFRRFFDEVAQEHSDLTRFGNAAYNKIFYEELPSAMNRLRTDRSVEAQVRASTTYNMIIEGVMAETGYYAFHKVLTTNNLMPGMQRFVANLKRDESRHIAFAVYFLSRLVAEHGDTAWNALEARMNELLPLVIESNNLDTQIYTDDLAANGAATDELAFGLDVNEFNEYATTQFQKRIERIGKARNQSLEEINNIANSLDEVLA